MILPDINLLVYTYNSDAPLHRKALAIEPQAEVHSNDCDFARLPGLRWTNPLR